MAVEQKQSEERVTTMSGIPLKLTYRPEDLEGWRYQEKLADPGEFPFTRGPHANMYRGRRWTMRMFAGFGTPEDTNERFKFLLENGQTGLSTAFDMPTLMGYDPDHPMSLGEVGREGVAIATIDDMRRLFDGISLEQVSTSMTINAPAMVVLAFYVAVADEQGASRKELRGTTQNDMLKEFIAQKEWICPVRPAMRIIRDMMAFCADEMPKWNTISVSGYHIREAGATAVQELAFTLADGIGYVQLGKDAGLDVDQFAPRLSFFFDVHNDFFEEIAKLRAARRIWARVLRDRFKAKSPRSWLLRTHCQTAGVSLTAQQPYNNIVRTTLQALAGVLGGTQSLHTNSYDETYALPTAQAATVALRTQQIISDESGVPEVVDPLAGSYFIEKLTDQMESEAMAIIDKIDEMGGIVSAIEAGFPQREIAKSAYGFQRDVEKGKAVIVGINKYQQQGDESEIPTLKIDEEVERGQVDRIREFRARRDQAATDRALDRVREVARSDDQNLFPVVIDAVKANATIGEISDVFRDVFGVATDPAYW
ncbi:MAG: methylmalonyl-CoA mutase family protein [Deltaproteobacteria bacterium]|nr:methylmalonyl-CoA mutase family protein [Deltaproteobacteria bacterium]